jgi:hypothetical protein
MISKVSIIFFGLLYSVPLFAVNKTPLLDAATQPLGVIIRPSFFSRFATAFNQDSQIRMDDCIGGRQIRGRITGQADEPRWVSSHQTKALLSLSFQELKFEGAIFLTCAAREEDRIDLELALTEPASIQYRIDFFNFDVAAMEKDLPLVRDKLKPHFPRAPEIDLALQVKSIKSSLVRLASDSFNKFLGSWLEERLRGLAYAQSINELFETSDFWNEEIEIDQGAISLRNTAAGIEKDDLAFAFFPRSTDSVFVSTNQIEVYVNALFMDSEQIDRVMGKNRGNTLKSRQLTEQLKATVARQILAQDAVFRRPPLFPQDTGDLSLVLTEGLINEALRRVYQENLADFTTKIRMGRQVKGLITKEEQDVSVMVSLGSHSAPKIVFEPNQLKLKVSDYFLRLGTFLEDRLIPSTEIQAAVEISAALKVDFPSESVNLLVSPKTFEIGLSEETQFSKKLSPKELRLMERLAKEIWEVFFSTYQELLLFPTLLETTQVNFKIADIEVQDELIFIHLNLDEESLEL